VNTLDSVRAMRLDVPDSFGTKCNVIWTDEPNAAVMLTEDGTIVRKIRVATGTEQLEYGNYLPAGGGEPNGTWEVRETYRINGAYEVVQGAAWVKGKLVLGFGHGPMSVGVVTLQDDGYMDYRVFEDRSVPQYFGSVFYDERNGYFGGSSGLGTDFWSDDNFGFTDSAPAPTAFELPAIHGTPEVGDLLRAEPGTWSVAEISFTFQWFADGAPIAGATSATLLVDPSLNGADVTVTVTASAPRRPDGSATSAVAALSTIPTWDAGTVYRDGDVVIHDGAVHEAQWYSHGNAPGASVWGAWAERGTQVATAAGVVRTWTPTWIYTGGETVTHDGRVWRAKWWTRNQEPGLPDGPWEDRGAA